MILLFDGVEWKLNKTTSSKIWQIVILLKQVPILKTYFRGFLMEKSETTFVTYFVSYLILHFSYYIGMSSILCIIVLFGMIFTHIISELKVSDSDIDIFGEELPLALVLYITYRRMSVYMTWMKCCVLVMLFSLLFSALPPCIFSIIVPLTISSLFIETESHISVVESE